MRKRVKGGVVKNYCDVCGCLCYDHIPIGVNEDVSKALGMNVMEYSMKTYAKDNRTLCGILFCSEECEKEYLRKRKRK